MKTKPMTTPNLQPATSEQARFRRYMAAQTHRIEIYRWRQFLLTGHLLSPNEAAAEWIDRYASGFRDSFTA